MDQKWEYLGAPLEDAAGLKRSPPARVGAPERAGRRGLGGSRSSLSAATSVRGRPFAEALSDDSYARLGRFHPKRARVGRPSREPSSDVPEENRGALAHVRGLRVVVRLPLTRDERGANQGTRRCWSFSSVSPAGSYRGAACRIVASARCIRRVRSSPGFGRSPGQTTSRRACTAASTSGKAVTWRHYAAGLVGLLAPLERGNRGHQVVEGRGATSSCEPRACAGQHRRRLVAARRAD